MKTIAFGDAIVIDLGPTSHASAEEWEMLGDRCLVDATQFGTKPERVAESKYLASRCYARAGEMRGRR